MQKINFCKILRNERTISTVSGLDYRNLMSVLQSCKTAEANRTTSSYHFLISLQLPAFSLDF